MSGCGNGVCVPIGLRFRFSPFSLAVPQRDPFPEHAPVPGSAGEAVFVTAALWLHRVLLPVDGVNERHRTHRSDSDAHIHAHEEAEPGRTRRMAVWMDRKWMQVADGDTSTRGMMVSMLGSCRCLPVGLCGVCSLGPLSLAQWHSLPEQAPVPRTAGEAILVTALLGLQGILVTVYIVY